MCDPVTLSTIAATVASAAAAAAPAASAAATVLGAVNTIAAAKYQSDMAKTNAVYQKRAADDALKQGDQQLIDHYRQVAQLKGRQQVGYSAAGVDPTFGSAVDVATDTSLLARDDANRIRESAQRQAQGYSINADALNAEAKATMFAGYMDAGTTLLTSANKYAMRNTRAGGYSAGAA